MSVMEATQSISPSSGERRRAARLRPASVVRVTIGRGAGTILDVSRGGLRVRHTGALRRGADVRVAFHWQDAHFDATAEVLASRVESLGNAEHDSTVYVSRLRFARMGRESYEVLRSLLAATSNNELRRWVANLQGWSDATTSDASGGQCDLFIRCILIGNEWRKTSTHDRTQPQHGFLLPATVSVRELNMLCDTYVHASADARHLIRLTAAAVVEEAAAASPKVAA